MGIHLYLPRMNGPEIELHLWVDADKHLRKVTRKSTSQGKTFESTFLYTVVEDVTATAESFKFKVPDDAKDLGK